MALTLPCTAANAYFAGRQGGRKIVIDHAKVLELKRAGMTGKAIAAELGICEPSVWRILRNAIATAATFPQKPR